MSYLPCGCWFGSWNSILPPPQCDQHRGGVLPASPPPIFPSDEFGTREIIATHRPNRPNDPDPPTLESSIKVAIAAIQQEVVDAMSRGDEVALDAWREALEQLTSSIILIARARKAGATNQPAPGA